MSEDLALSVPQVTSLARPTTSVLLAARYEMQRNEHLRGLFASARDAKDSDIREKLSEAVLDVLYGTIKGDEAEIREAARYLVDEFFQLPADAAYLISSETGLPVARITDKDIWQPPPVMREDEEGNTRMVPQRPRLRPDLEGALIRTQSEKHRENRLVTELASKVLQTTALAQLGDPRLATVTSGGRAEFVEKLRADLPTLVPGDLRGKARKFLDHFDFEEQPGVEVYQGTAFGHLAVAVEDAYKACEAVKAQGGNVTREAGPVKGGSTVIAFVQDPDGYKVELIERKAGHGADATL